jgi:DNA polymerase-1
MQIGTTSGRYSSKMPNFQNLPRDDKRVKSCIVARPGKVFIGSDYSQLEPRVFASFSGDERLLACFENGDDFYSVIGASVFGVKGCSLKKDDKDSFAKKYPEYRQISKAISLSATYGTTAGKMAQVLNKSQDEAQGIIDDYFESFPSVKQLMLKAHNDAKANGRVTNLFGRPRRMPDALMIGRLFGKTAHADLPYEYRNVLNLAINHTIQSTGASIMNRAAIAFHTNCKLLSQYDPKWKEVRIIMQVHDEIIAEGPEELRTQMIEVLKDAMENTVILPGVKLIADPVAGKRISDLK